MSQAAPNAARSLAYAAANILHPRMLWLMLWPVLAALAFWSTVAFFLLGWVVARIAAKIDQIVHGVSFITFDVTDWTVLAAKVIVYLGFIPLVYMTALLVLGIFGMPAMVEHVAARSFPDLERRRGGGALRSAWNGVLALLGMVALAVLSVPLWLLPPLWPLIPLLIMAWANQRLLRYDALAEHADSQEMRQIFSERRGALYLLGFCMALAAYVPLVGFFVPAYFALAFIHYLLAALARRRELSAPMPAI